MEVLILLFLFSSSKPKLSTMMTNVEYTGTPSADRRTPNKGVNIFIPFIIMNRCIEDPNNPPNLH